ELTTVTLAPAEVRTRTRKAVCSRGLRTGEVTRHARTFRAECAAEAAEPAEACAAPAGAVADAVPLGCGAAHEARTPNSPPARHKPTASRRRAPGTLR
ncbi:MAG TPA: hypothetical protein VGI64_23765, partial [Streptosporangiaceae bacterium]